MLVAGGALTINLAARPAAAPQQAGSAVAVSDDRVREGAQRPQTLKIPPLPEAFTPVFRATVKEDAVLVENPLEGMRRDLAESSGAPDRAYNLLDVPMALVKKIQAARHARAESAARREVQAAISAFCAAHDCSALEQSPDTPEGIIFPRVVRPR